MKLPSDFDIRHVVDQLGEVPETEDIEVREDRISLQFQGHQLLLRLVGLSRGSWRGMDSGDADRRFVLVDDQVVEVDGKDIYVYELPSDDGEAAIVERFVEIFADTAKGQSLSWDELEQVVAGNDLFGFDTPQQLAEIVAGWTVTDSSDSVLDIASGTGSLLAEAVNELDVTTDTSTQVVGLEQDPFACAVARNRFQNVESLDIISTDFFEWNLEHGADSTQTALPETADETVSKFDAVIGVPPAVRFEHLYSEQRRQVREWAPGGGRRVGAAYVAKAVTHLKDGGRAAFVLQKSVLRNGLLEHLTETCALHRIVALPLAAFTETQKGFEAVIVTLVKEERSPEVQGTGVGKFTGVELPANARGLFEQPLDGILANRYNTFDAEIVKAAHEDLDSGTVMRLLSSPSIYDVLTEGGFTRLGDLEPAIEVGSGVTSGNNRLFYFDEEDRDASGIDDRFFRPLIKDRPEDTLVITEDEINQYVLDLQPYLDQFPDSETPATDAEILEQLEQDGYHDLVTYLESQPHPNRANHSGSSFTLRRRGKFQNPDLVLPEFFDEPRCYRVEVDDALFDSVVIGIQTETAEQKTALQYLLNTPLYKELLQTFGSPMDLDWYRINLGELRDVPVIEQALTEEVAEKLETFLPPEDDNDVIGANQVLIEACPTDDAEQALQRYIASRDDYAWSWFLTLPEVERFQELVEEDREKAQEFIIERFDQELLDKARQTFNQLEFFEHRRDLLNDLLMEFESNHYRSFLAGITLQFEGVLTDLVLEAGGDIVEQDGKTEFKLPGKNRSQQQKNLHNLISTFFDGIFSTFIDETIRQRRNAIAHGDVIEDDQDLAIHFFIAFYALCYASLAEYTRFTDAADRMA
ncbi:N-6 DNA methylase [Haloferax volcanii]|uniref:N-6 DNA methylase n=1 Tax=Haloferax volcanii TaxID=2246 RepID=UPI0038530EE7